MKLKNPFQNIAHLLGRFKSISSYVKTDQTSGVYVEWDAMTKILRVPPINIL